MIFLLFYRTFIPIYDLYKNPSDFDISNLYEEPSSIHAMAQIQATCSPAPLAKCASEGGSYEHERNINLILRPLLLSMISLIGFIFIAYYKETNYEMKKNQKTFHSFKQSQIEVVMPVGFQPPTHLTSNWDLLSDDEDIDQDNLTKSNQSDRSIGSNIHFFTPVEVPKSISVKAQNSFFSPDLWY